MTEKRLDAMNKRDTAATWLEHARTVKNPSPKHLADMRRAERDLREAMAALR
jgi:hypothetical protein